MARKIKVLVTSGCIVTDPSGDVLIRVSNTEVKKAGKKGVVVTANDSIVLQNAIAKRPCLKFLEDVKPEPGKDGKNDEKI